MLPANCSASGKCSGFQVSRITRCFAVLSSSQSSCAWRAACHARTATAGDWRKASPGRPKRERRFMPQSYAAGRMGTNLPVHIFVQVRMPHPYRLHARAVEPALRVFTAVTRVLLAVAFVPSGLVKILGEPFTTLPTSDPVGFFFAGFFSAHGYYRFIGVMQWTAAALLIIPLTATLGAALYLPIIVNIFAITVAIGPSFGGTRFIT